MSSIYVKTDGSDSNDGSSWDLAVQHIYTALDLSSSGDEVVVADGQYFDELCRNIGSKNITIRSNSGIFSSTQVKPKTFGNSGTGNRGWLWRVASNSYTLTLKNLELIIDYSNLNLSACNFGGASTGIFSADGNGNFTAVGCFCHALDSTKSWHFAYEDWVAGNTFRFYKCTCRHLNTAIGQIENTVYASDCIFSDLSIAIARYHTTGSVHEDHNCFFNNSTDIQNTTIASSDLTSDPLFVSSVSADLQGSSPCIDAGIVISGYVESYTGTAPDIGCYELSSPVVAVTDTVSSEVAVTLSGETTGGYADQRGFQWGIQSGNYDSSWTETGVFPAGSFSYPLSGLASGQEYFWRAMAHNSLGWSYGEEHSFSVTANALGSLDFTEFDSVLVQIQSLLEILLPSLFGHGLHVFFTDKSLFQEVENDLHTRISNLPVSNQALGIELLNFFQRFYGR